MTKDEIVTAIAEALDIDPTDVKIVRTNSFGVTVDLEVEIDDHEEEADDLTGGDEDDDAVTTV